MGRQADSCSPSSPFTHPPCSHLQAKNSVSERSRVSAPPSLQATPKREPQKRIGVRQADHQRKGTGSAAQIA